MPQASGLCFVIVADDEARFVRPGPDNRLYTFRTLYATSPPNAFARELTDRIAEDLAVDLYMTFVLIGTQALLDALSGLFHARHESCLAGTLTADLIAVPDRELASHCRRWLNRKPGPLEPDPEPAVD